MSNLNLSHLTFHIYDFHQPKADSFLEKMKPFLSEHNLVGQNGIFYFQEAAKWKITINWVKKQDRIRSVAVFNLNHNRSKHDTAYFSVTLEDFLASDLIPREVKRILIFNLDLFT